MLLRCCSYLVLFFAVVVGLLVTFGRNSRLAGSVPFLLNQELITEDTIPNLENKIIIVTGANAGLGKSTSKHLAKNGATVIMGCRSMHKCEKAKREITEKIGKTKLIPMELDLGSFASIKKFSEAFKKKYDKIHSLILNAGVMHPPFGLTKDGIEQQIGINHFGHFYLTKLLLPLVEKAQPSTIVSVSSVGHYMSYSEGIKLSLDEMNSEANYDRFSAYGQSKLANILFAQELSAQLEAKGSNVFVNAVHPGGVNTELLRHYPEPIQKLAIWLFTTFPNTIFFESDLAALVEVYAAVSKDIFDKKIRGKYMVPIGEILETHPQATDMKLQKGLWKLSEEVIALKGY